jgi:hypothetical protein
MISVSSPRLRRLAATSRSRLESRAEARVARRAMRLPLWPMLALVAGLVMAVQLAGTHATAWHYFHDAARLMSGDGPAGEAGGLHLYGEHPEFQFGPLSIAVAVPFSLLGPTAGSWAAMLLASAGGLLAFALLLDAVEGLRPGFRSRVAPWVILVAGATFVITWGDVAVRTAHIDDAIALLAIMAAVRWCVQRPAAASRWQPVLALTVAAAAKPWAIIFAPLALLPVQNPTWRDRWWLAGWLHVNRGGLLRIALVGVMALLTWAPFIMADPRTLDTAEFGISNDPTSVLRALGVSDPTTPSWVRPAQLIGGMALVAVVVGRGWWPSALLVGMAWRLLLDPGANRYYTIGLVLAALLVELSVRWNRVPWATVALAVTLEITAMPGMPALPGRALRLICVLSALAVVALLSVRRSQEDDATVLEDPSSERQATRPRSSPVGSPYT